MDQTEGGAIINYLQKKYMTPKEIHEDSSSSETGKK